MGKTENLIPNDIDLRRLVGLLSYLKKSDDVEQRHSSFQKSSTKIVRKFNESDILNLFNRLGI